MKTQGGGAIPAPSPLSVSDCLRFSMSLNVPVCLSGMRSVDEARQNIATAKAFAPLSASEIQAMLARVKPLAGAGALETFQSTQRFDSAFHQKQHGFP